MKKHFIQNYPKILTQNQNFNFPFLIFHKSINNSFLAFKDTTTQVKPAREHLVKILISSVLIISIYAGAFSQAHSDSTGRRFTLGILGGINIHDLRCKY